MSCEQEGLPEFVADKPLRKTNAWAHSLSKEEKASIKPLLTTISDLLKSLGKDAGGVHLIATFIRMQMQPLRARIRPMWEDQGPSDPTRMSSDELNDEEVVQKVKAITSLRAADSCNVNCPITPYGVGRRLPARNRQMMKKNFLPLILLRKSWRKSKLMKMSRGRRNANDMTKGTRLRVHPPGVWLLEKKMTLVLPHRVPRSRRTRQSR